MRRLFTVLLPALAIVSQGLAAQSLPSVSLEDSSGHSISLLSLFEGNTPVLLSLWGTYCKPCILELDTLSEMMDDMTNEVSFKIVAVCTDDSRSISKARAFAAGRDWKNITLLFDPRGELCHKLNINIIPHSFLFDGDGKLIYSHSGYVPGTESILIEKARALAE